MDDARFDALSRALAAKLPRRGLARLAALAPLAALPAGAGAETAAERRRQRERRERRDRRDRRPPGAGGGTCTFLDQVCSLFGNPCCAGTECTPTRVPGLTTCQSLCRDDFGCQRAFGTPDVSCVDDYWACNNAIPGPCCRPNPCHRTQRPCRDPLSTCCSPLVGESRCCLPGQRCTPTGCAAAT